MKILFDFFPIILFFVAYKQAGILAATAVAIAASFLQVGWYYFRHRKFENMHLVSLGLITVFGGLTLVLQDPVFIMWKPSILNWLFAAVFLGSQFIGDKPIIKRMMGAQIELQEAIWHKLNYSWVVFFIVSGVANLYVAFNYSEETWVNFKLFGLLGLTLIFIVAQALYLARYMPQEAEAIKDDKNN